MSRQIDEKIVEMKFDNSNFEKNVAQSRKTLDGLKDDLKLSNVSSGINNLGEAADKVSIKFDALRIAAETCARRITNYFIDTGKNLVSSLTIDQVTAGFSKYADKTQAVQTIMAATAKDFSDTEEQMAAVTEQLEKLNWFTDETSYNFVDMVGNIGKFTSNNIALSDAVTAMQGISTWAAISGANATEASRAMYNLSQAISVGAVTLMDWKSIENANMATAEFKQTAIDTAVELGTLIDAGNGLYKTLDGADVSVSNFNSELSKSKWFTKNVLMKSLDRYGAFTNKLYDISTKTGLTASVLLEYIEDYKKGTADLNKISEETGVSVEDLSSSFTELNDEVFSLGNKSFRAAQEAKTFKEAIDSVKDAVSTGWMNTFELIFGNYTEAKNLWTNLANELWDVFAGGGEKRNSLLKEWRDMIDIDSEETRTGRELLIDSFWNVFHAITDGIDIVKSAFRDIFPEKTAKNLYDFSKKLEAITNKLRPTEETSEKLRNTLKGLFSIIDILKQAFSAFIDRIVGPSTKKVKSLADILLTVSSNIGLWLTSVDEFIKKNDIFGKAIDSIIGIVSKVKDAFIGLVSFIGNIFNIPSIDVLRAKISDLILKINERFQAPGFTNFNDLLEKIRDRFSSIGEWFSKVADRIKKIFGKLKSAITSSNLSGFLASLGKLISKIVSGSVNILLDIFERLVDLLGKADFSKIIDLINSLSVGGISVGLYKFLSSFGDSFKGLNGILDGFSGVLEGAKGALESFSTSLKADSIKKIAVAVAILAASLLVLSLIDSTKLNASLGALTVSLVDLMGAFMIMDKSDTGNSRNIRKLTTQMIKLSSAILVLSLSLKIISSIDSDKLLNSMMAITMLIIELTFAATYISNNSKNINTGSKSLIGLSLAIRILASSVKYLGELDFKSLVKGLLGVGILLGELLLFLKYLDTDKERLVSSSVGLLLISTSLVIMSKAVEKIGRLPIKDVLTGIGAIAALLAILSMFEKSSGSAEHVISTGVSLVIIGAALNIISSAFKNIASIDISSIGKGLIGFGAILSEIVIALNMIPDSAIAKSIGILIVSEALVIMANAFSKINDIEWSGIAKGLVLIGGTLLILSAGLNAMNGTAKGAASLLLAVSSLVALAAIVKIISKISWEDLGKSIAFLAGTFVIFVAAGKALSGCTKGLLAFGASVTLVGFGIALLGAGLLAISTSFTIFSASADLFVASLNIVVSGILNLFPLIARKLAEFIVVLVKGIADSAIELGKAVKDILLMLIDVAVSCIPELVEGVLDILDALLVSISEHIPSIVDSIFDIVIKILDGVVRNLPSLVDSIVNVIITFFASVVDSIKNQNSDLLIKALEGVGVVAAIMVAMAALSAIAPSAMVGVLEAAAFTVELSALLAALGLLQQIPGLNWLMEEGGKLLSTIGGILGNFVGSIIGGLAEGISNHFPDIATNLSLFMTNLQPFIDGASRIDQNTISCIKNLAEAILILTAAEILEALTSWLTGGSSISEFGEELAQLGPKLRDYAKSVSGIRTKDLEASSNAVKALAEMAGALPNHGGVVGWITGDSSLSSFAQELADFGPSFMVYASSVKGIDSDAVVSSSNAAKALAEMAGALPNHGGVVGWFTGDSSLSSFGQELADFGPSFKVYASSIKGIDSDAVVSSSNAAKALASLAKDIPNSGGLISFFTGDNDIGDFGDQLSSFGSSFARYYDNIKDVKSTVVTRTSNAVSSLIELSKLAADLDFGGVFSDGTLENIGDELVPFGEGLNNYYNSISGIDSSFLMSVTKSSSLLIESLVNASPVNPDTLQSIYSVLPYIGEQLSSSAPYFVEYSEIIKNMDYKSVDGSVNVITSLIKIADGATYIGNVQKLFNNDYSLVELGRDLARFGPFMFDYANSIKNVDLSLVSASSNVISILVDMARSIPSQNGLITLINGRNSFSDFGKDLSYFGNYFAIYCNRIKTIPISTISKVTDEVKRIIDIFKTVDGTNIDTIKRFGESLASFGLSGINNFISAFNNKSALGRLNETVSRMIDVNVFGVINSIENKEKMQKSGINFISGFIKGLTDPVYVKMLKIASSSIGNTSKRALEESLAINSPSKETYKDGKFAVIGFINAFYDNAYLAMRAGAYLGENVEDGMNEAIAYVYDSIDGNMDLSPVITPVIDLSAMDEGFDRIDKYFSNGQSIRLARNASSSIASNNRNQNGIRLEDNTETTSDLRSELNDIVNRINGLQIVMDTGKLVGAIADPIDSYLGVKVSRNGRR